jgi:hypothetical protein
VYAYVGDNPTNNTDPSGLYAQSITNTLSGVGSSIGSYFDSPAPLLASATAIALDPFRLPGFSMVPSAETILRGTVPVAESVWNWLPPQVKIGIGLLVTPGNANQVVNDQIYGPNADPKYSNIFNQGTNSNVPPVPGGLVGGQDDPRAGPRKGGNSHTSGPLTPENGGTGDFGKDLEKLTGGTRPAQTGDSAPPGSLIGANGIFGRPRNSGGGSSIDIPANGSKPHETLHYP